MMRACSIGRSIGPIEQGVETATFHILTPYPGTALYERMASQQRLLHRDWDLYDTRHVVYQPARLSPEALEAGYWRAYRNFYAWGAIARGALAHATLNGRLRHFAYAAGWKKFEPAWDWVIRAKRVSYLLPTLESILNGFGRLDGRRRNDDPVLTNDGSAVPAGQV